MPRPRLQVKVNNRWLREIGAWGDLTYSHVWPGGSKEASWQMTAKYGTRLPLLVRGAKIEISWAGWPLWLGYLSEPDWNGNQVSFTANGLFRRGAQYKALDGANNPIDNPTTAINAATGIGWTVGTGVPNSNLGTGSTGPLNNIHQLMDASALKQGHRWMVDPFGVATMSADPTSVSLLIKPGAGDLGIAEDNYASHVLLRQETLTGALRTAIYPSPLRSGSPNAYEARYGHVEFDRDITDRGPMADATADSLAQTVYLQSKQRPGWTNGLQLARGEILNAGFKMIHPAMVRPNVMARLLGVADEVVMTPHTDFVVGETEYRDGDDHVTVNPVGLVSRSQEDVLTELLEAVDTEVLV